MGANKNEYDNAKETLIQAEMYLREAEGGSTQGGMEEAKLNHYISQQELDEARTNYRQDPNG